MACLAISKVLLPQIRAVEGLTSAVKGKKVVYKTETWAVPSLEPCFIFIRILWGGLEMKAA